MRLRLFEPSFEDECAERLRFDRAEERLSHILFRTSWPIKNEKLAELQNLIALLDSELSISVHADSFEICAEDPEGHSIAEYLVKRLEGALLAQPSWRNVTIRAGAAEQALPDVVEQMRSIYGFDARQFRVRVGLGRGHLLSVYVGSPDFGGAFDELAIDAAQDCVRAIVGDSAYFDWIGTVEVFPLPKQSLLRVIQDTPSKDAENHALAELQNLIARAIAGVQASLPEEAAHRFVERAEWVLFEQEIESAVDGEERLASLVDPAEDIAVCSTMLPEGIKCYLEGLPFASSRFSRKEEEFFLLMIPQLDPSTDENWRRRNLLEERLNQLLVPMGSGAVIGVGAGGKNHYFFLALTDLSASLVAIEKSVSELGELYPDNLTRFHGFVPGKEERPWVRGILRSLDERQNFEFRNFA